MSSILQNVISYREYFKLYSTFFLTILLVYKTPFFVSYIFLAGLLVLFYYSKHDYFWFAFFFMIFDAPGYILHAFDISNNLGMYGLPLGADRNLAYTEIFVLFAFLKALVKGQPHKFIFHSIYIGLVVVILYILFVTFAYEVSPNRLFRGIRGTLPFLLLYAIPKLMNNLQDFNKHYLLLLPFVFVVIGIQLLELFTNVRTVTLLGGKLNTIDELLADGIGISVIRPLYSFYILEWILIGVLFLITFRRDRISEKFKMLLAFLAVFSVFLSATRGVLLAMLIMYVFYWVFVQRRLTRIVSFAIGFFIALAFVFSISSYSDVFSGQLQGSLQRMLTLESLIQGDITAEGTLGRISVRVPIIMERIEENPIFGYGFSETYWQYHDGHIGHHNMILNSGFIGYIIFWLGIIFFVGKNLTIFISIHSTNSNRRLILLPIVALLGLLIHHSTTYTIFSYSAILPLAPSWFTLVFVISLSEVILKHSLKRNSHDF